MTLRRMMARHAELIHGCARVPVRYWGNKAICLLCWPSHT